MLKIILGVMFLLPFLVLIFLLCLIIVIYELDVLLSKKLINLPEE